MDSFYWLGMFLWFLKKDMAGSGGYVRVWSVTKTHVYSTKARVKSG
jgi:hypothetical protein